MMIDFPLATVSELTLQSLIATVSVVDELYAANLNSPSTEDILIESPAKAVVMVTIVSSGTRARCPNATPDTNSSAINAFFIASP